jgi:CSLREA domain-containing protein
MRRMPGGVLLGVFAVALFAPAAFGAPLTVNTTADHAVGACDAAPDCTLREAMTVAGANGQDDTITITATGTIDLTGELPIPELANHITEIIGPGAGSLTVRAKGSAVPFEVLEIFGGSVVKISGMTMTKGYCNCTGGALYTAGDLTLDGVRVTDSEAASASSGGGIAETGGALTIRNSTISGNKALGAGGLGGGIDVSGGTALIQNSTVSGNFSASEGGGIESRGTLTTVENSTISGNNGADGGGIRNRTTLSVENSTIAGNSGEGVGGGIDNYCTACSAATTLNSVTIVGNQAHADGSPGPPNGGGIMQRDEGAFNVSNSLITGNTIGHGAGETPDADDCDRENVTSFTLQAYNLVTAPGDCFGIAAITAPGLVGTLAFNGGPTATIGLLAGSPAHDTGNPGPFGAAPACPATDQRGFPRGGAEGRCDIGAFEGTLPTPVATPAAAPAALAPKVCRKKRKKKKRHSALSAKKKKKKKKRC